MAEIGFDLLEDVDQGRRGGDAGVDREAQAIRLMGAVIRILPQDDNLDLLERAIVESAENFRRGRKDAPRRIFLAHEFAQRSKIWFVKFGLEMRPPAFVDAHGLAHGEAIAF